MSEPALKFLRLDENYAEFLLENASPALANSIRRAIISDVPVLAIDEVAIIENSSVMFDEILAHRLGLVPLKVDAATYEALLNCYEEGKVDECVVGFSLEVEAERSMTVYSGHLKLYMSPELLKVLPTVDIKPVSELIPIVKLVKGQRVILEAYAKMGVGRDHAKWQPVSVSAYKNKPRITILRNGDEALKCAESCPRGVLAVENGKLVVRNEWECNLCRSCEEACPDVISVGWDDTTFLFRVEGVGMIPVRLALRVALQRLARRVERLVEAVASSAEKSE